MRCLDDAAAWEDDFERWWLDRCTFKDGAWSAIHRLHNDYNEWALHNYGVPCRLGVFEALLRGEGCRIQGTRVHGVALALAFSVIAEASPEEPPLQKGSITSAQLLEDLLRDGPMATSDIRAECALVGFAWATMLNAKRTLSVRSQVGGIWELPR
jgi:hypothetical protein